MSELVDRCVCQLQAPAGLRPTPELPVGPPTRQIRPELTNLWHAGSKRHAERFPWHATFTALPILFTYFSPAESLYFEEYAYIYTHI